MKKKILCFGLGALVGIALSGGLSHRRARPQMGQVRTVLTVRRDTVVVAVPQMTRQRKVAKSNNESSKNVGMDHGASANMQSVSSQVSAAPGCSPTAGCRATSVDTAGGYVQRVYEGEDYKAWVSGVDPELDSIAVYRLSAAAVQTDAYGPTPSEQLPVKDVKRWHLGVFAGCAVTPRGVQPAIGVGISYSFCSW